MMIVDVFLGLDKSPKFLADTMLPNTSPEAAAKASVLVNGGFDPFQYVQLPDGYTAAPSGAPKAYRESDGPASTLNVFCQ